MSDAKWIALLSAETSDEIKRLFMEMRWPGSVPRLETPDDISHEKRQDRIVCYGDIWETNRPLLMCIGFEGIGR